MADLKLISLCGDLGQDHHVYILSISVHNWSLVITGSASLLSFSTISSFAIAPHIPTHPTDNLHFCKLFNTGSYCIFLNFYFRNFYFSLKLLTFRIST